MVKNNTKRRKTIMTKQKNNRIPRSARCLQVRFLINTSGAKKDETATVYKGDNGWIGETESGNRFCCFVAMLRNPDVCEILSAS